MGCGTQPCFFPRFAEAARALVGEYSCHPPPLVAVSRLGGGTRATGEASPPLLRPASTRIRRSQGARPATANARFALAPSLRAVAGPSGRPPKRPPQTF